MLKPAIQYAGALKEAMTNIWFEDKYKYYNADVYWSTPEIEESTWNSHQFVSVCNDEVIGYISYSVVRSSHRVSGLAIISFVDNSMVFAKDLAKALSDIFETYNFHKLNFSVVVGNPIEPTYDKLVARWGGRIVGTFGQHVKLQDGKLYDEKYYEVLGEDYLRVKYK